MLGALTAIWSLVVLVLALAVGVASAMLTSWTERRARRNRVDDWTERRP